MVMKVVRKDIHNPGVLLLLISVLVCDVAMAQSQAKADSIVKEIGRQGERFELIFELARTYYDFDDEKAYQTLKVCYGMAISSGDSLRVVKVLRIMGSVLRKLDRLDSAAMILRQALIIAERNNFEEQLSYLSNSMGIVFMFQARYQSAIKCFRKSFEFSRNTGDSSLMSSVQNNIACCFYKMKLYAKALPYFERSLAIKLVTGDDYDKATSIVNIGICKAYLGRYDEALSNFYAALKLPKNPANTDAEVSAYYSLGVVYFELGQLSPAKRCLNQSYKLACEIGSDRFKADNLVQMGKVEVIRKQLPEAVKFFRRAEELSFERGFRETRATAYENLAQIDTSNAARLSVYLDTLIHLKRIIYGATLAREMAEYEEDLKENQNLARISLQSSALVAAGRLIESRRIMFCSLLVLSVFMILFIALIYYFDRRNKKLNEKLQLDLERRTSSLENLLQTLERDNNSSITLTRFHRQTLRQYILSVTGLIRAWQVTYPTVQFERKVMYTFLKLTRNIEGTPRKGQH